MSIMKKLLVLSSILIISTIAFIGCASTPAPTPVQTTPEPSAPVTDPGFDDEPAVEDVMAIPEPVAPKKEDEYSRSIGNVGVSKEVFKEDKTKILKIIDELSVVMKNRDYNGWLSYLDKESRDYYSKPTNLKKASSKMPKKGLTLTSLEDYFKYVFIPSRAGHKVDEIRYITENHVKVVEVREDTDAVYYNFKRDLTNKVEEKWKLNLPKISD